MPIVFKCKMCGGDLDIKEGATIVKCLYCGSKQTLPKIDDDKRRSLYSRANYFRQNGDFDKAVKIYEQILSEDNTDAETYWSLVLCRYGVEYVEDPSTHTRVPTVNRTQAIPVTSDADYKMALKYADVSQYAVYEAEARAIDKIQRDMLEISRREKPFDVFISYKDSDINGQRTVDSVLAVDLYEKLTQEGFKVFCSRITLEDKIGQKYEPYIFAALNSVPVMIALGTRPEYFNAVWVRNEWSRYLNMIHNGAKKTLIPAFRDMSPYELPEEFSHL
ncbi:MAG: TIR domain-containing protein, partial [Synergistaceae bacterium]|nr:TIR domain-containing protein [Synergistaceae bacterium]